MEIRGKSLTDPQRPYIIAEASGNHNQDRHQARKLVQAAALTGADAIKFQTFTAEEICADVPILFGHDVAHDGWCCNLGVTRMRELFQKGGLPRVWHRDLQQEAEDLGLAFLSTPFSLDAAKFLVEEVGVQGLKIASGDITFVPLLEYAGRTGLPTIMSTGSSTIREVQEAINAIDRGWEVGQWEDDPLVVLHCLSIYPCSQRDINLASIRFLRDRICYPVGLSDHTLSTDLVPAMAVACGAVCFEKHLRLASDTFSVDAAHSLNPSQFRRYVEVIREAVEILGTGSKEPHPLEAHERLWSRRDPSDWLRPTKEARQGSWE